MTKIKTEENKLVPVQGEAEALIAKAIDKNVPVGTMERLLTMRRELKAEWAKEQFDKAMAAFQAECPTIEKRKQGYNYKYAALENIIEQVKGLLAKNGFSYTFDTEEADNAVVIFCKIKHIDGHSDVSKATIKKETTTKMNASQQSGAAMTYGKRYAFVNAFGILTGDEDTDAHEPPGIASQQASPPPAKPTTYLLSYQQQKAIFASLNEKGYVKADLDDYISRAFKKESITKLTVDEANITLQKIKSLKPKPKNELVDEPVEEDQLVEDAVNAGL